VHNCVTTEFRKKKIHTKAKQRSMTNCTAPMLWSSAFLDFFHRPKNKITTIKITTFRKLVLLPSSGEKQNQLPKCRNFNCRYSFLRTMDLKSPKTHYATILYTVDKTFLEFIYTATMLLRTYITSLWLGIRFVVTKWNKQSRSWIWYKRQVQDCTGAARGTYLQQRNGEWISNWRNTVADVFYTYRLYGF
jgi:hypothetical protein